MGELRKLIQKDMWVEVEGENITMEEAHNRWGEDKFPVPIVNNCFTFAEYGSLPLIPPLGWISGGVLPIKSKLLIFAEPKAGKSFLALQMAFDISEGKKWLGFDTHACRTLDIQAEIAEVELQDRVRRLPTAFAYAETIHGAKLLGSDVGLLEDRLKAIQPSVLILDPLYMYIEGDLTEVADVTLCNSIIDKIIYEYGCSVVVIHHSRKPREDTSQGMMEALGSVTIPAFYDSILWLEKVEEGVSLLHFVLRNAKSPLPILLSQKDNGLWERVNIDRSLIHGVTITQLMTATGFSHNLVDAYLRREVEAGAVVRDNFGHYNIRR